MLKRRKENKIREFFLFITMYFFVATFGAWRFFVMLSTFFTHLSAGLSVGFYLLFTLFLLVAFFIPRTWYTKFLDSLGSYWMSFQFVFVFYALMEWVGKLLLVNWFKWLSPFQYAYISLGIFSFALVFTFIGVVNARIIRTTTYHCLVEKLKNTNQKISVVHLTDLHIGSINDLKAMKKIVNKVNQLKPDLVCITGDTFTETLWDVYQIDEIAKAFKSIQSTYGTYACLGNHDSGKDFPRMLIFFEKAHIKLLPDEYVTFDGITLFGRNERYPAGNRKYKRGPLEEALEGANRENIFIVMDHQPADIEETAIAGADLLLSGHTHGGHFFPMHLFIKREFPQYKGMKKYGNLYCVISAGTYTTTPPIRLGSKSEIVHIILEG